jgi:hypothetical protein
MDSELNEALIFLWNNREQVDSLTSNLPQNQYNAVHMVANKMYEYSQFCGKDDALAMVAEDLEDPSLLIQWYRSQAQKDNNGGGFMGFLNEVGRQMQIEMEKQRKQKELELQLQELV